MKRIHVGSALAVMTLSITSSSCFDVRAVDPGPPVLDDFEDGDLMPSLSPFTEWSCRTFVPDATLACALTSGAASSLSLSAEFSISDPPDLSQQHGGVLIETDATWPIDLSALSRITFDIRLTSATTTFSPKALMYLALRCSTAVSENGGSSGALALVQSIAYTPDWTTVTLAISNFGPTPWLSEHIAGGAPTCLRAVDGIQFAFDAAIPDGQSGGGILSIDNVRLQ